MNNLFLAMYVKMQNLMKHEEGQDLIEYALVAALIAGLKTKLQHDAPAQFQRSAKILIGQPSGHSHEPVPGRTRRVCREFAQKGRAYCAVQKVNERRVRR